MNDVWKNNSDCFNNNYLSEKKGNSWFLTPCILVYPGFSLSAYVTDHNTGHFVGATNAYNERLVYPTFYLKPNIKIISGDGSENNPYVFQLITE